MLSLYIVILLIVAIFASDMYMIFYALFQEGLILNILFPIITIILSTVVGMTLNYFLEIKQNQAIKVNSLQKYQNM